jgi:hypothetical protein
MSRQINPENWAMFALTMAEVRAAFPEHGREIDKCIYDVGQKLESCGDPNCTCRMTFENFRARSNRKYQTDGGR